MLSPGFASPEQAPPLVPVLHHIPWPGDPSRLNPDQRRPSPRREIRPIMLANPGRPGALLHIQCRNLTGAPAGHCDDLAGGSQKGFTLAEANVRCRCAIPVHIQMI